MAETGAGQADIDQLADILQSAETQQENPCHKSVSSDTGTRASFPATPFATSPMLTHNLTTVAVPSCRRGARIICVSILILLLPWAEVSAQLRPEVIARTGIPTVARVVTYNAEGEPLHRGPVSSWMLRRVTRKLSPGGVTF